MAEAYFKWAAKNGSSGPSHSAGTGKRTREQQTRAGRKRKKDGQRTLVPSVTRPSCIVSTNDHMDREPSSPTVLEDEEPVMVLSNTSSSPRLTQRPISLDSASGDELTSGSASGERRSQNGDGLREGGAVVDLTNDSGVEDEDVVDLTSPIQIVIDQEFQRFTRQSQRGAPEMVIVQESDDEVQVINSPVVPINRSTARKRPKYSSNTPSNPPPPPSTKSTLQCPICLDTAQQFESSGRSLVTTVCGHIFCNVCIRNSIQRQHKCPTCRKKLTLKQYHELFV